MAKPEPDSSPAAWAELNAEAERLVARRLRGHADADDVAQEVLLRVWRKQGMLREGERFGAWLARVAHNATNDHLRIQKRRRLRSVPLEKGSEVRPAEASDDARDPVKACLASALAPFVAELPAHYREVIVLSELEQLPHAAIAERLGVSVSGVKSRVQRGRRLLREKLDRCCAIAVDVRGKPVSCEPRPAETVPAACRASPARD